MLPRKSNKIISEINDFFTSSEKVISKVSELFKSLKLSNVNLGIVQAEQSKYPKSDLLLLLLLYPLYSVSNMNGYLQNAFSKHIEAKKDTFYRFKNDSKVNWRRILYMVNSILIKQCDTKGNEDKTSPNCLIVDDSDLPKTGKRIEHLGKVWSHTMQRSILGFKGLMLGYWNSKSFIGLDFSLHKEKGRNKKFPFGMRKKDIKIQYSKQREKGSYGKARESELFKDKIKISVSMIKRAIRHKIRFRYVLMDSWFVCAYTIREVRNTGHHLVGMAKMGNTNYLYGSKSITAHQISESLKRKKLVKRYRKLGMHAAEAIVYLDGIPVKLVFCRLKRSGKWNLLVTTDTSLNAEETFRIYSIRWSIEVFFKETKQYFGLGKSQSRDFDAQIADTTICVISYNIFSIAKRFTSYETLGELFRETSITILEMTICQRLWGLFLEIISIISDLFDVEPESLMKTVIEADVTKNNKLIRFLDNTMSNAA